MKRRELLFAALAAGLSPTVTPSAMGAAEQPRKRLLLRSSWQAINIGDIAHTPGMLAWLEQHLPDVEVRLWPSKLTSAVEQLLQRHYPKVALVQTPDALQAAFRECDFLLHGSGPSLVAAADVERWHQETGKPYGVGGITFAEPNNARTLGILNRAQFVFFRDTTSLRVAKGAGCQCPRLEFGPDATFALTIRNDAKADAFLKQHGLVHGKFACFVPRLRWTPYWNEGRKYAAEEQARKEAENEKYRELDHAKLRMAIVAWVRETGLPALLCPEMTYAVPLLKPLLFDPLPEDVKRKVVVRPDYWLTDEAASTYARSAAVVSIEMHSPIIAIANGVPAIHIRTPTDTHKGQMWNDLGLADWLFYEIDETTGEQIASRLLTLHRDATATKETVTKAQAFTVERGRAMMAAVAKACAG